MQIGILDGLRQIIQPQATERTQASTPETAIGSAVSTPPLPAATDEVRELLSSYDLDHITPREFSELVEKLAGSDQIDRGSVELLEQLSVQLEQSGLDPDRSIDLVDYLAGKLRQQEIELDQLAAQNPLTTGEREAVIGPTRKQLDWLQKLSAILAGPIDWQA